MGFLDNVRKMLGGQKPSDRAAGGGGSSFGAGGAETGGPNTYWVYAQCRRCGEPLKARINLMNDPSLDDDGEGWIVRKGLIGSGANRCFQSVEVTLKFDAAKRKVLAGDAVGGKLITAEEYAALQQAASSQE